MSLLSKKKSSEPLHSQQKNNVVSPEVGVVVQGCWRTQSEEDEKKEKRRKGVNQPNRERLLSSCVLWQVRNLPTENTPLGH